MFQLTDRTPPEDYHVLTHGTSTSGSSDSEETQRRLRGVVFDKTNSSSLCYLCSVTARKLLWLLFVVIAKHVVYCFSLHGLYVLCGVTVTTWDGLQVVRVLQAAVIFN